MHDVARPGRGRKPRLVHEEDVFWGHDGTYVDIEGTQDIRQAAMEERGERKPEFVAPGAEQKWRARNLVDIHWALTAIKTPSESYNRVLSCIIDHANPHNGLCYPSQSIIAIETGYSVETVKRAIRWWKKQGFLKTESRGLGHALAYHPQWDLLEGFWVGVMSDIEEQKASRVTKGTYDVGHQGDLREGHQGDLREGHHADLQNLKLEPQTLTPKNEPHPERVISPSVEITTPLEGQIRGKEKEGIQGEPFMKAPSSSETQREEAEFKAHGRIDEDLRRLPRDHYSAVIEWLPYPGDVYHAAIAAEIDVPNTGAVVVLDAYRKEKAK
jgi:Helix-turn-helix domain